MTTTRKWFHRTTSSFDPTKGVYRVGPWHLIEKSNSFGDHVAYCGVDSYQYRNHWDHAPTPTLTEDDAMPEGKVCPKCKAKLKRLGQSIQPTDHCKTLSIHEPHEFIGKDGLRRECPGIPHDHEHYCCTEHHTHAMPHVGCILR
jgi:hypothetical protein